MTLAQAKHNQVYRIDHIHTDDEELSTFLFTLGCYSGEPITLLSHQKNNYLISIKDARYNIDAQLAQAIQISFF